MPPTSGGLLAGGLCALGTAPRDALSFETGRVARAACGALLVLSLAALAAFGQGLARSRSRRHSSRRCACSRAAARRSSCSTTTPGRSRRALARRAAARAGARAPSRAVEATRGEEPNLLDTLAEIYFQLGREPEAVATIESAIALAPGVDYFEEQRLRFLGERAADDRPEPPEPSTPLDPDPGPEFEPQEPVVPSEGPGLRV